MLPLWCISTLFEYMLRRSIHINKSPVDLMVYFPIVSMHTQKGYTHNISVYLMVDVLTVVMHLYGVYILKAG